MLPCAILGYAYDRDDVQAYIDAATRLAVHQRRRGRAPRLYDSGVRYRREMHATLPGVERIQTPEETYAMGAGDCDDLAPWLAADYLLAGIDARAWVVESPGIGYHVVVVRRARDGRLVVEDPSARLGMLEVGSRESRRTRRRAMLRKARAGIQRAARLAKDAVTKTGREKLALLTEAKRLASQGAGALRRLAAESDEEGTDDEA